MGHALFSKNLRKTLVTITDDTVSVLLFFFVSFCFLFVFFCVFLFFVFVFCFFFCFLVFFFMHRISPYHHEGAPFRLVPEGTRMFNRTCLICVVGITLPFLFPDGINFHSCQRERSNKFGCCWHLQSRGRPPEEWFRSANLWIDVDDL